MGIRPELYVEEAENGNALHVAATTMSRKEKKELCQFLQSVKFPSGYMPILAECEMSLGEVKVGLQKSTWKSLAMGSKTMWQQAIYRMMIIKKLVVGRIFIVMTYQAYDINGYTFYTIQQDKKSIY